MVSHDIGAFYTKELYEAKREERHLNSMHKMYTQMTLILNQEP